MNGLAEARIEPRAIGEVYSNTASQYSDAETATNYNGLRDYDQSVGRYIESDPIGLDGRLNTYVYVKANPLSYFDSQGLDSEVCICRFYPVAVPGARHCFIRFNRDHSDTLTFDHKGVHADENPEGGGLCTYQGRFRR